MGRTTREKVGEESDEKLADLMLGFGRQFNSMLEKTMREMAEADKKMKEYQKNVEQLRKALKEEITRSENDMKNVRQALTDLCQWV